MHDFTFEVSHDQPIHPDPAVASTFFEVDITDTCGFGCKIYGNPRSSERILAHNSAYGCKK